MKLPLQWINEYAKVPVSPKEYQDKMVMCGTGIEGIEDQGAEIVNVVVGRVMTVDPVENSDHLHVCKVDIGREDLLQIVCGAPNVKPDILVPVALEGAVLPGGHKIKKGKLRGVMSEGMLCSGSELGVPIDLYPSIGDAGLLIFNEDYELGIDVRPILGLDDVIIDFEILANRPDCLSVLGVARETAVAMGTDFKAPDIIVNEVSGDINEHIAVSIEDKNLCKRYIARVIKNIRIAPSPFWLRKYLHGAGMRSINNIVDITNFVMLETGHPMHAFDLDKVAGRHIIVRKAKQGEMLKTLDGKERRLSGIELLICDENGPTGVAGVMGGEESEITENTKSIVFECAVFDRTGTRLAARGLGMRTESSGRFEKGVAPQTALNAMERACQLVNLLNAGDVLEGIIDIYANPSQPVVITASCDRIAKRTGVAIPKDSIINILTTLHFDVKLQADGDTIIVTVPDFRQDVDGEADLCEEVLRIYGYDAIPSTNLRGEITQGMRSERMILKDKIVSLMDGMGYYEIMKFSFISEKSLQKLALPQGDPRNSPLKIRNPLGEDTSNMRPTLVPAMLETLALNQHQGNDAAKLYEIAAIFDANEKTAEGLPIETQMMSIGTYGKWTDFYVIMGVLQALFTALGISAKIEAGGESYHHPGRCAKMYFEGNLICILGEVHPSIADNFGLIGRAYIAEINLNDVLKLAKPMSHVKPLPKYPSVIRDLALVMPDGQPVGPVIDAIKKAGGQLLEHCAMFDIYRGLQLGAGIKSVAFTLVFRSDDHTLTEGEVNTGVEKILKACDEAFGAKIRA